MIAAMAGERREELLELASASVRSAGITELSLRPLAAEIGSSPRVLLFLFGSKDGLVRALLDRARADELALLRGLPSSSSSSSVGLAAVTEAVWQWLSDETHR